MASPLKVLPRDRILTIIAAPARNDLANIREQGLKIGGQRIAGAMQMPHHLIQIISKAHELRVNEPFDIVAARSWRN